MSGTFCQRPYNYLFFTFFPIFLSVCAHFDVQCFDVYSGLHFSARLDFNFSSCLDFHFSACLDFSVCFEFHVNQIVGTDTSYSFCDKSPRSSSEECDRFVVPWNLRGGTWYKPEWNQDEV